MTGTIAPHHGPRQAERLPSLLELARLDEASVLERLHCGRSGLPADEVTKRRAEVGLNLIAHEGPPAWYQHLWHAWQTPFNYILLALGGLSYVTGDAKAVVVVGTMVALSTVLRFTQEFRSGKAALALQAMVKTTATVEREGHRAEVPIEELVPGDIVRLSAGDMVPADVRVLSAKDLFLSQSALTGESGPVEKHGALPAASDLADPLSLPTIAYLGTNVVSGTAVAVVIATGDGTYFGGVARDLLGRVPPTSFDLGVNRVSWLLVRFMLVMVPVVFLINGLTKGNWLEAFLFGLAVAVGLTPEMLPMVVTANLAKGAVVMSRRKTVVKRLNAIQNLGAMDVLCTDKTGTLTQDRIVLEQHLNPAGEEDDSVIELAYLNSYHQTGLKSLLDEAVLKHAEVHDLLNVDRDYVKVDEIPFDFTRRRMSVVVERDGRHHVLIAKGAVEEMLGVCSALRDEDRTLPLGPEARAAVLDLIREENADGLRVVAVAYREFPAGNRAYSVADESELVLAGFISFLDPPKETAGPALKALRDHGVTVKILTGDNDLVTRKICHDVDLLPGEIVLGPQIQDLSEIALADLAERTSVFAKLTPAEKVRVVRALRSRGHTVGFLGDGINDAGALREADVGISVETAVDVAKESADIILLEKSLLVLVEGVEEGRRIFGNIMKYLKMTASSNFGNVFSVVIASVFLPFLPMLPIQLLVQNLLYDFSQIAIPWDGMDAEYLAEPRRWSADDIGRFMARIGPVSSIFDVLTFLVMWHVFGARTPERQALFQSGWFVEGLLTQTLIVHMIRTARVPFLESRAATPLVMGTTAVVLVGLLLPFTPVGAHLGFVKLPLAYFPFLLFVLLTYAALVQVVKGWYIRRYRVWL
jgi:Mg2+-importing ATPase